MEEARGSRTSVGCAPILRFAVRQSRAIRSDRRVLRTGRTVIHIDLPRVRSLLDRHIQARKRSGCRPAMELGSIGRSVGAGILFAISIIMVSSGLGR